MLLHIGQRIKSAERHLEPVKINLVPINQYLSCSLVFKK